MRKKLLVTALTLVAVTTLVATRASAESSKYVAEQATSKEGIAQTVPESVPTIESLIDKTEIEVPSEEPVSQTVVSNVVTEETSVTSSIAPTKCITEEEDMRQSSPPSKAIKPEIEVEDELIWVENENNSPYEVQPTELIRVR